MKEKWKRSLSDIAADAGVVYDSKKSWLELSAIIFEKWNIESKDLNGLVLDCETCRDQSKTPFLFQHETCAFCQKAKSLSKAKEFGIAGICKCCILQGLCYDVTWVINGIMVAISKRDISAVNKLVEKGSLDVLELVKEKERILK